MTDYYPPHHITVPFTRESYQRLNPSATGRNGFLDNVVLFHYMERLNQIAAIQNQPKRICYVHASYWGYYKLYANSPELNIEIPAAANFTYFNRLEFDWIFTLIHLTNPDHWVLGFWNSSQFIIFDPLGSECSNFIRSGIQCIARDLHVVSTDIYNATPGTYTLQADGHNCGVICLLTAEQIILTGQTECLDGFTAAFDMRQKLLTYFTPLLHSSQHSTSARSTNEFKKRKRREVDKLRKQKKRSQQTDEEKAATRVSECLRKSRKNHLEEPLHIEIKQIFQNENHIDSGNQELCQKLIEKLQNEAYCGSMHLKCPSCGAKFFKCERKGKKRWPCCDNDIQRMPSPFSDFPPHLKVLFERNIDKLSEEELISVKYLFDPEDSWDAGTVKQQLKKIANEFHLNIRKYNSAHSFTSMSCKTVKLNNRGAYCYKVHGQIYHNFSENVENNTQQNAVNGQLYFIDTSEATEVRMKHEANKKCSAHIMWVLTNIISEINVFAKSFKMMKDVCEEQRETFQIQAGQSTFPRIAMVFNTDPKLDKRRYNPAQSNEIAAVFVSKDGSVPLRTDIMVYNKRESTYHTIKFTDKSRKALAYPLFFPKGSCGWHPGLREEYNLNGRKVTQNQYIRHLLAIRDSFNPLHHGGKLFHQFLVDSQVSIEQERLLFIQLNQKKLKSDTYENVKEKVAKANSKSNVSIGRTVILPSTFVGGPRYMSEHYQDAMAIVRDFGKPDLFITFTCNSNWREIQENLMPNQNCGDRPDLVARVFKSKLNMLMNDLCRKGVLGKVTAWIYVIEYQKRGLPHAHILLIMDSKVKTPDDVDRVISAEIPSDPVLKKIVVKHMIHCCGDKNPKASCMEKGSCTKNFPKDFLEMSKIASGTFALPRRRNNGHVTARTIDGRTVFLDNRWVVPYSPILSAKYEAHINTEICSSVVAIKYIFKYVYKGHDRTSMKLDLANCEEKGISFDETQKYVDARFLSAPEAFWRISEYDIHERSHAVQKLSVHLPDQHFVPFTDDANDDELENRADEASSTLLAWFKLNEEDPRARAHFYTDIPKYYTWKVQQKKFTERKKRKSIGRMYFVSFKNQEKFYLRMLLLHVKGATSFKDLLTAHGTLCQTFREAALKRGLLQDDNEWRYCLLEANHHMTAYQMRCLFVIILDQCHPSNPKSLYEEFKKELSEDWIQKAENYQQGLLIAYSHLEKLLNDVNSTLSKVGLEVCGSKYEDIAISDAIDTISMQKEGKELYKKLNEKQKEFADKVLSKLNSPSLTSEPACFYLDGPGGSGKTFVYNTLCKIVLGMGLQYITMAFTGIAAQLLPEGQTLHSSLGLPLEIDQFSTSSYARSHAKAQKLKDTDIFIVDEASMVSHEILRIMDQLLRDVMMNNTPFGGKIVICGGDFRQILPVKKRATRPELIGLSLLQSPLWPLFDKVRLTENMRVRKEEQEFTEWLIKLGENTLPIIGKDQIQVPSNVKMTTDIAKEVFGQILRQKEFDKAADAAILTPTNKQSAHLNNQVLMFLEGETREFISVDTAQSTKSDNLCYPVEFLNSIEDPGLPPHRLRLKEKCVVMLLRNLSIDQGLCNGTRLQIQTMEKNTLICKILTGTMRGCEVAIPRIPVFSNSSELPIQIVRHQFPVRVAYAMTINKSQGQTFDRVGIYLEDEVFTHGQLYVAFSRVTSVSGISLQLSASKTDLEVNPTIKNVVFSEVFRYK